MSVHDDAASRYTSVSKRAPSTASRAQTLIKRNIAVNDLKPSDILIERFQAWKLIVKMLISYFEGIADIENNTARELTKLGSVIQVPFKAGNHFLGEGGMQDVFYGIRDRTRINADHHANFAKTVEGSIVQHLEKLRFEIKAHIKNVQNDTGKLAANVAREREMSTKNITDLARAISMLKNSPMAVMAREDPYAQNVIVARQLQKQVNEENSLQKSIIMMQHNSANFEEGIVRSIQSAWQTFDEWQTRMTTDVQETWRVLGATMGGLSPTKEWVAFAGRSDHLLDPDTPLRNPETIDYPGRDDPSVIPVHVGLLERKKRFTRSYKESYFVLTPAGYLHEYASSDPRMHVHPVFSLFLPACTLGPPSSPRTSRSHKFHIEAKRDSMPGGRGFHIGSKEVAYTFRARSHDEMMEWWNDVRMLVARYLVASETIERTGPVDAAVRAAGYISEEEEEEGGSSMEDEEEEEGEDEGEEDFQPAQDGMEAPPGAYNSSPQTREHDDAAPAYSARTKEMQLEMGANGYPLDKKHPGGPNNHRTGQPPPLSERNPLPERGTHQAHQDFAAPPGAFPTTAAPDDNQPISDSTDLQRRISRRQEKAPEGKAPHTRPRSLGEDLMPAPAPTSISAPRAANAAEKPAPAPDPVDTDVVVPRAASTAAIAAATSPAPAAVPAPTSAAPVTPPKSTVVGFLGPEVAKTTAPATSTPAPASAPVPAAAPAPDTSVAETTAVETAGEDAGPAPIEGEGEENANGSPLVSTTSPGSPSSDEVDSGTGTGTGTTPKRKLSKKEKRKSKGEDGEKSHGLFSRFKEVLR